MDIPNTRIMSVHCPTCGRRNTMVHGADMPKGAVLRMFNPIMDCYSCRDRFRRFMKQGGFIDGETVATVRDT